MDALASRASLGRWYEWNVSIRFMQFTVQHTLQHLYLMLKEQAQVYEE